MRVFLIAGEASGDALGGALMAGLRALESDLIFDGVGGAMMREQGLESRFDMTELSVMGIAEVLPKYRHLKRRIAQMAQAVIDTKPDVLITIDSPDFCLRVARIVKATTNIRTVHYVAPSVWAWRPKRAHKMAQCIDHVLALLPFEPPYMEAAGMACDFVGHPVTAGPVASDAQVADFRQRFGLNEDGPVLLMLPGSRKGEVSRIGPVLGETLSILHGQNDKLQAISVVAPAVDALCRNMVADWPCKPILVPGDDPALKRAAFRAADLALAASGTVALELAAAETPMVVAYNMNWLSFRLIKRMSLIDRVNLVNIITDTYHVPELLGPDCKPEKLVPALERVLADPSPQLDTMQRTMQALGAGGEDPGLRAAKAVLSRM